MSDSGAEAAAATGESGEQRPPKLHHRARSFVKNRSGKQKVTGLAAVALLVTAPFGGLKAEPEQRPAPLHLKRAIDIGPFDITVQKVVSLTSLSPTIKPTRKGDRLLVVEVLVRNRTDRPQYSLYAAQAVVTKNAGVRPGDPRLFLVKDGSDLNEQVNPGLGYQVAMAFEQRGDWRPGTGSDRPEVGVGRWRFQADDPLTLDPGAWVPGRLAVVGPVDVEVK